MQFTLSCPAKLNLSFDIIGRDPNGYHQLITLFQTVDLADKLTFEFIPATENSIVLSLKSADDQPALLPLDGNNLIYKAIKLFLARLFQSAPLKIAVTMEKNIPIGAGLAGGSSNAAATLIALSYYFKQPFEQIVLMEMAAQLGADVAFCLYGGLAVGQGYGQQLQRLPFSTEAYFVLIKPHAISISTQWAYGVFDQMAGGIYTNIEEAQARVNRLINQLKTQSPHLISRSADLPNLFWNSFEPAIFKEFPVLSQIKEHLLEYGCLEAHLTGSGPTIYGLLPNKEQGEKILKKMLTTANINTESQQGIILEGWLAKSVNHGAQILARESHEGAKEQQTFASS